MNLIVFIKILLELVGILSICFAILIYFAATSEKALCEGKIITHAPDFGNDLIPIPSAKDLEDAIPDEPDEIEDVLGDDEKQPVMQTSS